MLSGDLTPVLAGPRDMVVSPADDLATVVETVLEGGRIVLKAGVHRPRRALRLERPGVKLVGEPGAELHPPAGVTEDALLTVAADGVRIVGLVLDGEFEATRAIRSLQGSRDLRIEECEIRYWAKHAVDLDGSDQLVSNCHIHDILQRTNGARSDAHGIVTLHAQGLRIQGCRIENCSGDSFQADRGIWQDIEISDCDLSQEPLDSPLGGFPEGDLVGENAIDVKRAAQLERGRILVEECRMWGFQRVTEDGHWAALNLKENVAATVRNSSVSQSQIGLRLAGFRRGSPLICRLENCSIETCEFGIRFEDLRTGPEAAAMSLSVENCQFAGCELHLLFLKSGRIPGQALWHPPKGIEVSHCRFDPQLQMSVGTGDSKLLKEAIGQLLSLGENREVNPTRPDASGVLATGATDPASSPGARPAKLAQTRRAPIPTAALDPPSDTPFICPHDSAHQGRVYRRAAGQLHCRCDSCGAVWKTPEKSTKPPTTGAGVASTDAPAASPPTTAAPSTTATGGTGSPPAKVVK
ncbi:MAG: right-handed parallel beta-helix repeat-containing protein [Planctomycetaceae bacterium]